MINIERLKREAKKMHRETGAPHSKCLDELAKKHGFENWSQLMKSKGPGK